MLSPCCHVKEPPPGGFGFGHVDNRLRVVKEQETWVVRYPKSWDPRRMVGGEAMFNLLVQYGTWDGGRGSVSRSRVFEYTEDDLRGRFTEGENLNLEHLIRLPCLFMEEGTGHQLARVGHINSARQSGGEILIDYSFDPDIQPIPNATVFAHNGDFDMLHFEFSRTHWSVKDVDLYRILLRLSKLGRRYPKVFDIPENERIESSLVSVMMPFGDGFSPVYQSLREAAEAAGLRCQRADEIWEAPAIIQDIVTLIAKSFVVICDCSGRNPNVFYELGIAHTLGREVVMVTQSSADVPFDLKHLRYISYLDNAEGREALKTAVTERLVSLVETA